MTTNAPSVFEKPAGSVQAAGLVAFLAVAAVMAIVFAVYWGTSAATVQTWARSETYTHGFLVLPAVLWFVWLERGRMAATEARAWWPGLAIVLGGGALWLVGELASALAPTQWALVLMAQGAVLALFGLGWGRLLVFPVGFLFFAVPFGEAFTPALIDWTADFTVAAVAASGVPVFREGQYFVIPSGRWAVVEACSGVRYLMASIMVGVLYAWTMYRSPVRRVAFIVASAVVPIVANWLRAYLIVMIGHLSDNRLAVGIDHFIYGWVFFGIVILLLFLAGARWREDHVVPGAAAGLQTENPASMPRPPLGIGVVIAIAVVLWPALGATLSAVKDGRPLQPASIEPAGGWIAADAPATAWQPSLQGATQTQTVSFARDGAVVSVTIGHYRDQRQGSELVNAMNRLAPEQGPWRQIGGARVTAALGAAGAPVRVATLRTDHERIRVWHWYRLNGRIETSDTRAKLLLAFDRLRLDSDTSAWVAIHTSAATDAAGDRVLDAFMRDMGRSLGTALDVTASR